MHNGFAIRPMCYIILTHLRSYGPEPSGSANVSNALADIAAVFNHMRVRAGSGGILAALCFQRACLIAHQRQDVRGLVA